MFSSLFAGIPAQRPQLVRDLMPGSASSNPEDLAGFFGTVLFRAATPGLGAELIRSDGTSPGTVLVKNIRRLLTSGFPVELTMMHGVMYFQADGGEGPELWRSDGTEPGTTIVADLNPGPVGSLPRQLVATGSRLFFTAATPTAGEELWVSRGTAATTRLVADLVPGALTSAPRNLTVVKDRVFFTASTPGEGRELWVSDGTPGGTRLVADIIPGSGSSGVRDLTPLDTLLYFVARHPTQGVELWFTDGTTAGTSIVRDLRPLGSSNPIGLTRVEGAIFFFADDGQHGVGPDLWRTEPRIGATQLIADLTPSGTAPFGETAAASDLFYFVMRTALHGRELWRSDGTAVGTVLVSDLNPGTGNSNPHNLTPYGFRRVAFAANDGTSGTEPYITQGQSRTTDRLTDLAPGTASSTPGGFVVSGGSLFFAARDDTNGRELWRYDFGAVTTPTGIGCGVPGRAPALSTDDPVIGRGMQVRGRCGFGGSAVSLLIGTPARRAQSLLGCLLAFDPAAPWGVFATSVVNGTRFGATVVVPNDPGLLGLRLAAHAVVAATGAPRGFDATNGVELRIGR